MMPWKTWIGISLCSFLAASAPAKDSPAVGEGHCDMSTGVCSVQSASLLQQRASVLPLQQGNSKTQKQLEGAQLDSKTKSLDGEAWWGKWGRASTSKTTTTTHSILDRNLHALGLQHDDAKKLGDLMKVLAAQDFTSIPKQFLGMIGNGVRHVLSKLPLWPPHRSAVSRPKKVPFNKDSRVLIVGGGPAGISMASALKRKGYANVTILEKEEDPNSYGKTYTHKMKETGFIPHEMGTCYLSGSYMRVRALVDQYLGKDATMQPAGGPESKGLGELLLPSPSLSKKVLTSTDWIALTSVSRKYGPLVAHMIKKMSLKLLLAIGTLDFAADVIRFRLLHQSVFGKYDYHGLPPMPADLRALNGTFAEFMRANKQETILDLTVVGFGSYGFGYDIPALYGLWFCTPKAVEELLLQKVDKTKKPVELMRAGFSSLWRAMVEKDSLNLIRGADVTEIRRSLKKPSKPIQVVTNVKGKAATFEADFLIYAAPLNEQFLSLVQDASRFEKRVVESIKSVGLVVNLLKTAHKGKMNLLNGMTSPETALTFYPESLMEKYTPFPNGEVYAERNNVLSYNWTGVGGYSVRYDAVYQHYTRPVLDNGLINDVTKKAVDFITDASQTLHPVPSNPAPELLLRRNWNNYFPHFSHAAIQAKLPWKVFAKQGLRRTWYIGSSVSFESSEDVVAYNEQLLEQFSMA